MIVTNINEIQLSNKKITKTFKRTNYVKLKNEFNNELKKVHIYECEDPNAIADILTEITKTAIENSTIVHKIRMKERYEHCEWLSLKTLKLFAQKEKISSMIRKSRHRSYTSKLKIKQLKRKCKSLSNRINHAMKNDELKYYAIQCNEKNPKKLWQNLNRILGRKEKDNIQAVFDMNGNILTDDLEIAESFNNNFISSIESILNENDVSDEMINEEPCEQEINTLTVSDEEIERIINSLKNASQGIDKSAQKLLKQSQKRYRQLCPI